MQGHTKQVNVLVDSVASNGREAELLNELAAQINDLALESTDLHGLLAGSLEVLCGGHLVMSRRAGSVLIELYLPDQHRPLFTKLVSIIGLGLLLRHATY